jgi:hypothetical protein
VKLTPGPHNELQKAVIEEFLPRFVPDAKVLYLGDAAKKLLFVAEEELSTLGLPTPGRGPLPDVVAYDAKRDWVFFIEAVHSFGPITPIRREQLRNMAAKRSTKAICITAFPNRRLFARFSVEIGWETEVWIASDPSHLIHFDGEKYLSPYD